MDRPILTRGNRRASLHRYPRGWPIVLFMIVAIIGAISVAAIEKADAERRELELDRNLTEIALILQRRILENKAILRAGAAFFQQREIVGEAAFREFAGDILSNGDLYGSSGIGWAPLVPTSQLARFEIATNQGGKTDFLVSPRPAPRQRVVVPVLYIVPQNSDNRRAIGFDMYSEPVRRAAIEDAIGQSAPVVSGKVELIQTRNEPGVAGFLMYMPVRSKPGKGQMTGVLYSPFRADSFLQSASSLVRNRAVEIELYDESVAPENLLARNRLPGNNGASLQRRIEAAGRTWIVTASQKETNSLSMMGWLTALFSIVASLLVLIIGLLVTRRAVADQRTLEVLANESAIRDSLTRELNHRVKNTLANVLSIASLTRSRSSDIDEFHGSLTARIRALSATHDLLSESDWRSAPLREVIRSELAPYMKGGEGHVSLTGPDIALAPKDAMSLGLAIHELATNAAKYGALSVTDGAIQIDWDRESKDVAVIHWRETGGPPVSEPTSRGFGRDLIEKVVAHELGTKVNLEFKPAGVECTLYIPVREAAEFALRTRPRKN